MLMTLRVNGNTKMFDNLWSISTGWYTAPHDPAGVKQSAFLNAYVEAALWSSIDNEGTPLDANHGILSFSEETWEKMRADCKKFLDENDFGEYKPNQAGHDFWLTRNDHGVGFWDGDYDEPYATKLTKASEEFGTYTLYVGDDGKIYGIN